MITMPLTDRQRQRDEPPVESVESLVRRWGALRDVRAVMGERHTPSGVAVEMRQIEDLLEQRGSLWLLRR